MDSKDLGFVIGMIIVVVIFLLLAPVLLIWSINTLFQTNTPLNFTTFIAALVFMSIMKVSTVSKK